LTIWTRGFEIVSVSVEGVHPAKIVAPAFEGVVSAAQRKEANRLSAEAEAIGVLTRVVGTKAAAGVINREKIELDRLRSTSAADAKMSEEDLQSKITEQEIKLKELIAKAGGEGRFLGVAGPGRAVAHAHGRPRACGAVRGAVGSLQRFAHGSTRRVCTLRPSRPRWPDPASTSPPRSRGSASTSRTFPTRAPSSTPRATRTNSQRFRSAPAPNRGLPARSASRGGRQESELCNAR